jgi:hypothetical protein
MNQIRTMHKKNPNGINGARYVKITYHMMEPIAMTPNARPNEPDCLFLIMPFDKPFKTPEPMKRKMSNEIARTIVSTRAMNVTKNVIPG